MRAAGLAGLPPARSHTPPTHPPHRSTCSRFCPGGCGSKLHRPTDALRLVFALDDPALSGSTTYSWASNDVNLTAVASSASKQVRQEGDG